MTSFFIHGHYPPLGDIVAECVIESWGTPPFWTPSGVADDPGSGTEWYIDSMWSESERIKWYVPTQDYRLVEAHLDEQVQRLEPPEPDYEDW